MRMYICMLMLVASTAWGQTEEEASRVHLREYEQQLGQLQKLAQVLEQLTPHRSILIQLLQNADPGSALIPLLEDLPIQEQAQPGPATTPTKPISTPLMVSGVFVPSSPSRTPLVVLTKAGKHYQVKLGSTVRVEDKTYRLALIIKTGTTRIGLSTYTLGLEELDGGVINLHYPVSQ